MSARTQRVKHRWKQFRYRMEEVGVRLVAVTIPLVPRRALLALAALAGAAFYRFDARSRRVALENLRCAFPKLSASRRDLLARGSARNFARTFLDLFWARNLTPANWRRFMVVEGADAVRASRARHGGSIMCSAHFGNFEWASLATGFEGEPRLVSAQEFKNARLDAVFSGLREISGHQIVPRTQVMLKMLRAVKGGRPGCAGVGMLVDLSLPPTSPSVALRTFGGLRICAPLLHALLHDRTRVPITPVSAFPQRDGRYRIVMHSELVFPPDTPIEAIAQGVWDRFEKVIRRRPSLWLWSYKHFRYRPTRPECEHPWYANPDIAFDSLVARADAAGGRRG